MAKRLREHVSDKNKPPILIFPEGTCINNTSVMQFKKGSFEVGGTVYPVAIKVRVLADQKSLRLIEKLVEDFILFFSTILGLGMHFGIAASTQCFNICTA